jgi:hypothetical protein
MLLSRSNAVMRPHWVRMARLPAQRGGRLHQRQRRLDFHADRVRGSASLNGGHPSPNSLYPETRRRHFGASG